MSSGEVLLPSISDETYDPIHNVGRTLIDAAAQMTQAVDRRAQDIGITAAQWVVLIRIADGIGNTASELCQTLGYDSGAMTRMLDRLGKLGLVQRKPSIEDRRVTTISLTPAGEALYPRIKPIAIDVLSSHLRNFTPEEIEQLLGFLERIIANGQADSRSLSGPDGAS
ncbi:MarR family transcriptional regulator [Rhizobium sp. ACO-34A]|nr:MarR family transcriptional regulator [Rhizobium sp. ACO-34A]ATN36433.1 MarR family transcriptional regulator [Rhizobium sp. ACO-34A]